MIVMNRLIGFFRQEQIDQSSSLLLSPTRSVVRYLSNNVTHVTLENGEDAIIFEGNRAVKDGAAYIVDQHLGFNLLPETIPGVKKTIQEYIPGQARGEIDFKSKEIKQQILRIGIFDYIVARSDIQEYETGRTTNNMIHNGKIIPCDYEDSFGLAAYNTFFSKYVNFTLIPDDILTNLERYINNKEDREQLFTKLRNQGIGNYQIDQMNERIEKLYEVMSSNRGFTRSLRLNFFTPFMSSKLARFAAEQRLLRCS